MKQEPYGWIVVTKDDYDYADNLSYVIKQREYSDYVEDFPLYRAPAPCDKDAEIERLRGALEKIRDEGLVVPYEAYKDGEFRTPCEVCNSEKNIADSALKGDTND